MMLFICCAFVWRGMLVNADWLDFIYLLSKTLERIETPKTHANKPLLLSLSALSIYTRVGPGQWK